MSDFKGFLKKLQMNPPECLQRIILREFCSKYYDIISPVILEQFHQKMFQEGRETLPVTTP